MNVSTGLRVLLAATLLFTPIETFAIGRGGGGGGGRVGGGGGGGRPSFSGGGGGARPNPGSMPNRSPSFSHPTGGGSSRPNISGGNRPNISGGASAGTLNRPNMGSGNRPNIGGGNAATTLPGTANRPNVNGGNRPNIGGGNAATTLPANVNRPNINGGNRPNIGGGNAATTLPANVNRPNINGGNRPNIGGGNAATTLPANVNRPNINGGNRPNVNINGGNRPNLNVNGGNRPNVNVNGGNRPNFGGGNNFVGGNNFNNIHNNINIATNRPYYNNWQHGNWNGNWNRPNGGGYWNGWAHGYAHGSANGYWHGGWGGYWHGGWGGYGYWGRPWYASPITWGLGAWAVGSVMYNSGYASYNNPYYVSTGSTTAYYDYSQPITVINQQPVVDTPAATDASTVSTPASAPSPEIQEGSSHMELARELFRNKDYVGALRENDLAIKSLPNDAALHEFRALIYFATKDYRQSAATLYAVLSAGPGWDWTTLSGMYADVATYTEQLRQLETYVRDNPSAADARFVVAYHYMTCGYPDSARTQFEDVIKLQPENQLAIQLLTLVGGGAPTETAAVSTSQPPATETTGDPTPQPQSVETEESPQPTPPPEIDQTQVVGKWNAQRKDGSKFALELTPDGKFTWGFEQGTRKQEFSGKYSVDGAVLVLERTDGSQMPGIVTFANNGFNFKLYGGPPDDTGLDFGKS